MNILAINGSPRKSWNTAKLLEQILQGASEKGAAAELVHLVDYTFQGCRSCFSCKILGGSSYGRCAVKDDLRPILDKAEKADVLVLGAPIYFGTESALMRSCMERLWFQYKTYSAIKPSVAPRKKATALVYTMNIKEADIPTYNYEPLIQRSKSYMELLFAPCEVMLVCDTKQFNDYSRYDADMWDAHAKYERYETVFPQQLQQARALGQRLVS